MSGMVVVVTRTSLNSNLKKSGVIRNTSLLTLSRVSIQEVGLDLVVVVVIKVLT